MTQLLYRSIEQQMAARNCPVCGRNVRPYQSKHRSGDYDLCAGCWRKTPAGNAHHRATRKSQSLYGDLKSNCRECVHWLNGACSLEFPDRDPACAAYLPR